MGVGGEEESGRKVEEERDKRERSGAIHCSNTAISCVYDKTVGTKRVNNSINRLWEISLIHFHVVRHGGHDVPPIRTVTLLIEQQSVNFAANSLCKTARVRDVEQPVLVGVPTERIRCTLVQCEWNQATPPKILRETGKRQKSTKLITFSENNLCPLKTTSVV